MTVTELNERMGREHPLVLVDVREHHEREIADLPGYGQLCIPVGDFLNRMNELDPNDNIVVYCRSGARSGWAVLRLMEQGFENVWNLKGGILAWRNEVDPTLQEY